MSDDLAARIDAMLTQEPPQPRPFTAVAPVGIYGGGAIERVTAGGWPPPNPWPLLREAAAALAEMRAGLQSIAACTHVVDAAGSPGPLYTAGMNAGLKHLSSRAAAVLSPKPDEVVG